MYCHYAKDLPVTLVENTKYLYGNDMVVHNTHGLQFDAHEFGYNVYLQTHGCHS